MHASSRRELFVAAAGTVSAPPRSDASVLRHLLDVEHVVEFCYAHVLGEGLLSARTTTTVAPFLGHEREHVGALAGELARRGGAPPRPPASVEQADRSLSRLRVTARLAGRHTEREAVQLLIGAEAAITGAYYEAVGRLRDTTLIERAAQAMAAEAQHATALRRILHPRRVSKYVSSPFVEGLH